MALTDVITTWSGMATRQLIVNGLILLVLLQVSRFFYRGICIRIKFRQLQSQGTVVPAPYSILLGHLPLFKQLAGSFPKDANGAYVMRQLVIDWPTYFPGATSCPPVIYLDLWPIFSSPMLRVNDAALCQDVIGGRFPPRHELSKYLARAISRNENLFEWDGAEHRLWRSRLNPGFSAKNLQMQVAKGKLVEEVSVFVERLKKSAGADGGWGEPFQMFPRAIDLTFDIICGVVLNFSPGEQINGPTELQCALRSLIADYLKLKNLALLPKQLNPLWHLKYYRIHERLRQILLPHIQSNIQAHSSGARDPTAPKTVIDLALQEVQEESKSEFATFEPPEDFIKDVIGLTKQFIFAGHDTTAITLSFALHYLWKSPDALRRLRAEHDQVFGTETTKVPGMLRESPHLLGLLPYTAGVVKETLRLTAIAASFRQSSPGFVLRDHKSGRVYPTDGCALVSGVLNLHIHPDLWPRPTEFLPERWVVGEDDPLYPATKYAWRPFEWGPMSCIGQELAVLELKMALLFTVRELEFETALEEWKTLRGKSTEDIQTVNGDSIYQMASSPLGPPTEGLPMRVKLMSRA